MANRCGISGYTPRLRASAGTHRRLGRENTSSLTWPSLRPSPFRAPDSQSMADVNVAGRPSRSHRNLPRIGQREPLMRRVKASTGECCNESSAHSRWREGITHGKGVMRAESLDAIVKVLNDRIDCRVRLLRPCSDAIEYRASAGECEIVGNANATHFSDNAMVVGVPAGVYPCRSYDLAKGMGSLQHQTHLAPDPVTSA